MALKKQNHKALPVIAPPPDKYWIDGLFACGASHARTLEFASFKKSLELRESLEAPLPKEAKLVEILADIPYLESSQSAQEKVMGVLGLGNAKLSMDDMFLARCVEKRDHLIAQKLGQARSQTGSVSGMNFSQKKSLSLPSFPEFSATGDVIFSFVDGADAKHAVAIDWRTECEGRHPDATEDQRLMCLAVLVERNDPSLQSVSVASFHRENVDAPTRVARYSKAHLVAAHDKLLTSLQSAKALQEELQAHLQTHGGTGEIPESLQLRLEEKSVTGSHCGSCEGKACCTKLAAEQRAFARAIKSTSLSQTKIENMTNEDFLANLRQSAWLKKQYEPLAKVHKELESIAKALLGENKELDGCSLKPGARTWSLRETFEVEGEDGAKLTQERPVDPQSVYKELLPLLGNSSLDEFLREACEVNAASLRDLLQVALQLRKPADLEDKLEEVYGGVSVLSVAPRAASLVVDTSAVERVDEGMSV